MASSLGQALAKQLKDKGLSIRGYAKLIGHPNAHSYVSKVLRGVKSIPVEDLEAWIKPLGISQDERRAIRELALLDRCPDEIQAQFLKMKARIAQLEAKGQESP